METNSDEAAVDRPASPSSEDVVAWLAGGNPAVAWQAARDLLDADEGDWQRIRARTAAEGVGARLLAHQDPEGTFAHGAHFPRGFDWQGAQPWTATSWSLKSLREWGVPAGALLPDTAELIAANCTWEYEDLPYWGGETDACINGFTLGSGAWLGADVDGLADWFVEHQTEEGGWNCEWVEGSVRSSFDSTLNALEGILAYEQLTGRRPAELVRARHRASEYLLAHDLLRFRTTGQDHPTARVLGFPFRHHFSALRAADFIRAASVHDHPDDPGAGRDERMREAVEWIRGERASDGTWHRAHHWAGAEWFDEDAPVGHPSPWLTLQAMRVLRWWNEF